jgi:hypothetical protein
MAKLPTGASSGEKYDFDPRELAHNAAHTISARLSLLEFIAKNDSKHRTQH